LEGLAPACFARLCSSLRDIVNQHRKMLTLETWGEVFFLEHRIHPEF
jgi:hypothetical protein